METTQKDFARFIVVRQLYRNGDITVKDEFERLKTMLNSKVLDWFQRQHPRYAKAVTGIHYNSQIEVVYSDPAGRIYNMGSDEKVAKYHYGVIFPWAR